MATAPVEKTNVGQFLDHLSSTGILLPSEFAALKTQWDSKRAEDAGGLARELVQQSKLTKYQAASLYQGKPAAVGVGPYVFLDRLGTGGSGSVYKARHKQTGKIVAVKVLSLSGSRSADALKRFQREAETASRLNHPNIVRALEAGEAGGRHYCAMEFAEGMDLSTYVKKQGPMNLEQAVECIVQAGRALAYAHEQGIIHRDIKPANLMLCRDGKVKVLDMGLARLHDPAVTGTQQAAEGLTQTGQVMGTVDYMAPEQALHTRLADARADVYSLGVTFYRLVTGDIPYDGDSLVAKILAHREQPIPSLGRPNRSVPPAVDYVFKKMLAKKPEDRYQTMNELVDELLKSMKAGSTVPMQAPTLPPVAVAVAVVDSEPRSLTTGFLTDPQSNSNSSRSIAAATPKRRTPVWFYIAASMLLAAAAGGAWVIKSSRDAKLAANMVPEAEPAVPPPTAATAAPPRSVGTAVVATAAPSVSLPTATAAPATAATSSRPSTSTIGVTVRRPSVAVATTQDTASPQVGAPPLVPSSNAAAGDDRQLAVYCLDRGLAVVIWVPDSQTPREIHRSEDLPEGEIILNAVMNQGTNLLRDDDLQKLAAALDLSGLVLRGSNISREGLRAVIGLPQLQTLILNETPADDNFLPVLKEAKKLTQLELANTRVSPVGIESLVDFAGLEKLNLAGLFVTDEKLSKLASLKKLKMLNLGQTQLTDLSVPTFANFPALESLTIVASRITPEGRRQLTSNLPNCTLDPPNRTTLALSKPVRPRPPRSAVSVAAADSLSTPPPGPSVTPPPQAAPSSSAPSSSAPPSPPTTAGVTPPTPDTAVAPPPKLPPIPEDKDVDEALALIRDELFKDDYAAAKKPAERAQLGEKIYGKALTLADDLVGRYAMLREARDLAIEGGSVQLITTVAHAAGGAYDLDAYRWIAEACDATTKKVFAKDVWQKMVASLLSEVDAAVSDEKFEAADKLLAVASIAGRKAQDAATYKSVNDRTKEYEKEKAQFIVVKKARETLAAAPDDPAANTILGKHECFVLDDWDAGLKHLAKGNDAVLREASEKSTPTPTEGDDLVALADFWWSKSEKPSPISKELAYGALRWYTMAALKTTGLTKSKVDKRIADARKIVGDSFGPKPVKVATVQRPPVRTTVGAPPATGLGSPPPVGAVLGGNPDAVRALANWVFQRRGGLYILNGNTLRYVYTEDELNRYSPYTVRGVSFYATRGASIADADVQYLAGIQGLNEFVFYEQPVSNAVVGMLSQLPIYRLTLSGCPNITDAGLAALQNMPRLSYLTLSQSKVTDAALGYMQNLTELDFLYLDNTAVTDAGLTALANCRDLDSLHLQNTQVTGAGLAVLANCRDLDGLYLANSKLNDAGLQTIAAALPQLNYLYLADTAITDAAVAKLSAMSSLNSLDISGCRVTDASAAVLSRITTLTYLKASRTGLSPQGLQAIQTQLPKCRISTN